MGRSLFLAELAGSNFIISIGICGMVLQTVCSHNFKSTVFQEMYNLLQMKKTRTNTYHQQGNEQVEAFHRTLKTVLKTQLLQDHRLDSDENNMVMKQLPAINRQFFNANLQLVRRHCNEFIERC